MTLNQLHQLGLNMTKQGTKSDFCAFDVFQLLSHVFSLTRSHLILRGAEEADTRLAERFLALCTRRADGYPLQYLLGEWEFYGLSFTVTEGVLIPRADTETLVDHTRRRLQTGVSPVIADLCSGSGCIAVTLATLIPDSTVYAVELSENAFPVLCRNIERNHAHGVYPLKADVLAPLTLAQPLDCIVSNPPYIRSEELSSLQTEVQHEPVMALDGGQDGLIFYRTIARQHRAMLKPGGLLAFEIGCDQSDEVCEILRENAFTDIQTETDLGGIPRVVSGILK